MVISGASNVQIGEQMDPPRTGDSIWAVTLPDHATARGQVESPYGNRNRDVRP